MRAVESLDLVTAPAVEKAHLLRGVHGACEFVRQLLQRRVAVVVGKIQKLAATVATEGLCNARADVARVTMQPCVRTSLALTRAYRKSGNRLHAKS